MRTSIKLIIVLATLVLTSGCDLERLPYDGITDDKMEENSVLGMTRGNYAKLKEEYYYKTTHYVNEYGGTTFH